MTSGLRLPACVALLAAGGMAAAAASLLPVQTPTVKVIVARADVRSGATDASPVVGQVGYGQVLESLGVEGSYVKIVLTVRQDTGGDGRVAAYLHRSAAGDASRAPDSAPPLLVPAGASSISVSADIQGKSVDLAAAATRAVPVGVAVSGLDTFAVNPALQTALKGDFAMPDDPAAEVSWAWVLPNAGEPMVVGGGRPLFTAIYNHATRMNVNELMPLLVRLVPAGSDWWLVGVARGRTDAAFRVEADWVMAGAMKQSTVPVTTQASGPGLVAIRPSAALPPGEYAIVLRPLYVKKYAGAHVFGNDGDGLAFSTAWRFTIR